MSNTLWNKQLALLWRKSCTPCQDLSCREYLSAASEEGANSPKNYTGKQGMYLLVRKIGNLATKAQKNYYKKLPSTLNKT